MKNLININQDMTMSSREIAELTGKNHADVMRDIRVLKEQLDGSVLNYVCTTDTYEVTNEIGTRTYDMYQLDKELCNVLLDKYKGLNRVPHRLREESSLKTIEQLLGITLIRQYRVLNYRIDGYDPVNNVAYEIDEPEHKYKQNEDDERQRQIEKILKCTFVRIKL